MKENAAGYHQAQNACSLIATKADGAILLHECDATRGASRAPLLVLREEGYALVLSTSAT
jgi:hypothetical protein